MYRKYLYPLAAGALVLAFFGETSVEWLQGGSVLMGVGMASIFATGKPALSVSSHVAAFFVYIFCSYWQTPHWKCSIYSAGSSRCCQFVVFFSGSS
jgi:hypothetical protein